MYNLFEPLRPVAWAPVNREKGSPTPAFNDATFDAVLDPRCTILRDTSCGSGQERGAIFFAAEEISWCCEKTPKGMRVVFTRFLYDRYFWRGIGCSKYAMYRLPDGSERSIMFENLVTTKP